MNNTTSSVRCSAYCKHDCLLEVEGEADRVFPLPGSCSVPDSPQRSGGRPGTFLKPGIQLHYQQYLRGEGGKRACAVLDSLCAFVPPCPQRLSRGIGRKAPAYIPPKIPAAISLPCSPVVGTSGFTDHPTLPHFTYFILLILTIPFPLSIRLKYGSLALWLPFPLD